MITMYIKGGKYCHFLPLAVFFLCYSGCQQNVYDHQIFTVDGPIIDSELGFSLSHEHVMSNFGKDIDQTPDYDTTKLYNQVIPYLKKLKAQGLNSIFDCTTAHFGRRPDLLKRISNETGIHIITNTGFYGAAGDRYIPQFAFEESVEFISGLWIDEFKHGINNSSIRPGFIKLAFDDDKPLSEIDKKLFKAGVFTHLKTGLSIAVHTGKNMEAVEYQKALLKNFHVDLSAWIWTHANKVEDDNLLLELASEGVWVSLDGVKTSNIESYVNRIKLFKQHNLLNRLLVSHDGNGFPRGGEIRRFDAIFEKLIPTLLNNGCSQVDIDQIFIHNPRSAFKIEIRKYKAED